MNEKPKALSQSRRDKIVKYMEDGFPVVRVERPGEKDVFWWIDGNLNFVRFQEVMGGKAKVQMWNQEGKPLIFKDSRGRQHHEKIVEGMELVAIFKERDRRMHYRRGVFTVKAKAAETGTIESPLDITKTEASAATEPRTEEKAAAPKAAPKKGKPRINAAGLRGWLGASRQKIGPNSVIWEGYICTSDKKSGTIHEIRFTVKGRQAVLTQYNNEGDFNWREHLESPRAVGKALDSIFGIKPADIMKIPIGRRVGLGFMPRGWMPSEKREFGFTAGTTDSHQGRSKGPRRWEPHRR